MNLPLLMPDLTSQRFDCHSCTNCCRDLVVHLTATDREKIDRQNWAGRIEGAPYVRLGASHVLNHKAGCVFLSGDGKCRIHAEYGASEKPLACQLYPFTLEAEGAGLRVGLRFDCPSVARSLGAALPTHRAALSRLAEALHRELPGQLTPHERPIELRAGLALSEMETAGLVRALDDWIRDVQRPLRQRLEGVIHFVETLSAAKLEQVRERRFVELVELFLRESSEAVAVIPELPPPTERQQRLFRQAVFAHSEWISLEQARASFTASLAYRWRQLGRARRLASGRGELPLLGFETARTTPVESQDVQRVKPDAALSAEKVDELVTRYLRARVLTRSAFGPGYYGWPLLDGLAAMVLSVGVVGWLARYLALGEKRWTFEMNDAIRAIGIVDRSAGRAKELGARSAKWRTSYLRNDNGLLRLLRAFPLILESE